MPPTIVATTGANNANSFATEAEVDAYFDARMPLSVPWVAGATGNKAAIVMAARVLTMMASGKKTLIKPLQSKGTSSAYYYTSRVWAGTIATSTQAMAWPRIGLYDRFGRAIDPAVVPQDLKYAQAELAGQLYISDSTLNNDVLVQGITSIKAGSVSLSFRDAIAAQVLPDAVINLMVPGWLTDEAIEPALPALFGVI